MPRKNREKSTTGIYHVMLFAPNERDIEVYTDRYVYVREYNGGIRKRESFPLFYPFSLKSYILAVGKAKAYATTRQRTTHERHPTTALRHLRLQANPMRG